METLLVVAIIVAALAVVVQAAALLSMYLMSRRVADNIDDLVNEGHKLIGPLEHIATNLKTTSEDLVEIAQNGRAEIEYLRTRIHSTVDEVQDRVMKPIRECSAIGIGISAAVRTFFSRRRTTPTRADENVRQTPAA